MSFFLKAVCSRSNFFRSLEKELLVLKLQVFFIFFRISLCREMVMQLTVVLSGRENT